MTKTWKKTHRSICLSPVLFVTNPNDGIIHMGKCGDKFSNANVMTKGKLCVLTSDWLDFSLVFLSGTTCLVAVVTDKELTVANVGDSRGVLCDKDGNAIPLSHDHKPYQLKERKRIKKAGETPVHEIQHHRGFSAENCRFWSKTWSCEQQRSPFSPTPWVSRLSVTSKPGAW